MKPVVKWGHRGYFYSPTCISFHFTSLSCHCGPSKSSVGVGGLWRTNDLSQVVNRGCGVHKQIWDRDIFLGKKEIHPKESVRPFLHFHSIVRPLSVRPSVRENQPVGPPVRRRRQADTVI